MNIKVGSKKRLRKIRKWNIIENSWKYHMKSKFESIELTDSVRETLPGSFFQLPDGFVHYEFDGPPTGETIILVHGFSTPMFTWNKIVEPLRTAGFRVLRYDLYGRGFSDRPKTRYNEDLFDRQLLGLVQGLKLTNQKFHIMGLSMGGAISTVFTARHSEYVKSLTLLDSAGLPSPIRGPPGILKIPALGKFIFDLIGNKSLIAGLPRNMYHPERFPECKELFIEQMLYKGFRQAILATTLDFPLQGLKQVFEQVGKLPLRKAILWGKQDATIPFPASDLMRALIPDAEFLPIEDCGHMPQYEQPETLLAFLIPFLKNS
jgi:pimeloyl-ACP methyl ester carboxylesterase